MGYSKLMKRDTFKGNMFLFAVPKDQEKFTRITMQNIRAKQLQLQELQGSLGHHMNNTSSSNPPHYSQGILGPSEAHESNKYQQQQQQQSSTISQYSKEDRVK